MLDVLFGIQHSDASFTIQIGPSGTGVLKGVWPIPAPPSPVATITDSCVADRVEETSSNMGYRQKTEPSPDVGRIFVSHSEAEFIAQMREDLDELPENLRSSLAAVSCRRFFEDVGLSLSRVPHLRCAIFGDEEDGIELIAHSRTSMRQVSFEFGKKVDTIAIIRIDEEMRRSEDQCRVDHVLQLGKAIEWLHRR